MNEKEILDYVMNTPGNTNYSVLKDILNRSDNQPDHAWVGDGDTHFWITISKELTDPYNRIGMITLQSSSESESVSGKIDWGDGSIDEFETTAMSRYTHSYVDAGEYIITVSISSGTFITGYTDMGGGTYLPGIRTWWANLGALTQIELGDACVGIGNHSFRYSYQLKYAFLSDHITSIGSNSFQSCVNLKFIKMSNKVTQIGQSAFSNCSSLCSFDIPVTLTSLPQAMLSSNYSLKSIKIPFGVTSIDQAAFSSCGSLLSIEIPGSVTQIGTTAFSACFSLIKLVIGEGVTNIGNNAFNNPSNLSEVHVKSIVPPSCGTTIFRNYTSLLKIYVPAESVDAYKAAEGWSTYANYIFPEPEEI